MDHFQYVDSVLHAEDVDLRQIAAEFGTPCYVYSRATLERHWNVFDQAFGEHPHLVCYAVKANSNLAVLDVLARLGSGFDIVSVGELERVLHADGDPARVVFSGVGKQPAEIERALQVGIGCFNVESAAEVEVLDAVASRVGKRAAVSVRVNPDVDPETHPYISTGLRDNKFGVPIGEAIALYERIVQARCLDVEGVDYHIGSQITSVEPYLDALDRVLVLVDALAERGISISTFNVGGGIGIRYRAEQPPAPAEVIERLLERVGERTLTVHVEPGRAVAGNAGLLLTRVQYLKHNHEKSFAVVDAAMNDLIRPALYDSWHDIVAVDLDRNGRTESASYDVVGPVCESSDFLGKNRQLELAHDELLAVRSAGAYSFVMSSNYNSRPRAAEVMVDGGNVHLVRARETTEALFAHETLLPR
ncbi:MAG: diaminopimelate decarboxylase [Thiotrichales bacterium]|nr:diaminopimelate decarboxylase [Thiotrichales bacterium]